MAVNLAHPGYAAAAMYDPRSSPPPSSGSYSPMSAYRRYPSGASSFTSQGSSSGAYSPVSGFGPFHGGMWEGAAAPPPNSRTLLPAWDMESLKSAIQSARADTGEIRYVLESCTFRPRAQAFTTLINTCSRQREWKKALEILDVMKGFRGLWPNTYTYSAIISACSNSGKWEKSLEVFWEMKNVSCMDPSCRPNLVTYSAVITACERGGRFERALELFDEMLQLGILPDKITYLSVLAACLRSKNWPRAEDILDQMHDEGLAATTRVYTEMLRHYADVGAWSDALDLFLTMQMLGMPADAHTCRALMKALEAGTRSDMALQLLEAMRDSGILPDLHTFNSALRTLAHDGLWESVMVVLAEMEQAKRKVNVETATVVLKACFKGGEDSLAKSLGMRFNSHGLKLDVAQMATV